MVFNIRITSISADVDDWNSYMEAEARRRGVLE